MKNFLKGVFALLFFSFFVSCFFPCYGGKKRPFGEVTKEITFGNDSEVSPKRRKIDYSVSKSSNIDDSKEELSVDEIVIDDDDKMTLEENPFWEPVVEDSSEDDLSSLGDFSDDNKFVLDDSTLAPSWKVMPSWKVTPSKINFSESEMQKIVKKSPSCVDASLAVALVFLGEKLKTVSEKTPVELVFGDSLFGSKFIKDILFNIVDPLSIKVEFLSKFTKNPEQIVSQIMQKSRNITVLNFSRCSRLDGGFLYPLSDPCDEDSLLQILAGLKNVKKIDFSLCLLIYKKDPYKGMFKRADIDSFSEELAKRFSRTFVVRCGGLYGDDSLEDRIVNAI